MKWLQMFWEIFCKSQRASILAQNGNMAEVRRLMLLPE